MFETLEQLYEHYNCDISSISQYIVYEKEILDMFNSHNVDDYKENRDLFLWIGRYYNDIERDYDNMKKYYLLAIDKDNLIAMVNLGNYYDNIENYDLMKRYYLMAIDKGNPYAMGNLGYYYQNVEKDYDKMKKYYLMAIDKGEIKSMYNLGRYYENVEKNYDLMKKYYLMTVDKGNSDTKDKGYLYAIYSLGYYYHAIEKDYDKMKKYYLMAIDKGDPNAMGNLGYYYQNVEKDYDLMKRYYLMAIKKGNLDAENNIKKLTTSLERYVLYTEMDIPFKEKLSKDINIYKNKLKTSSKIDDCNICIENNKECILLNCFAHYICKQCYIKLYDKPCPFCRL